MNKIETELMLLNWSESSNRGRTVTFLLPEDTDDHPFKAATVKAGKHAGQRYMAVLVEIGDDEQPQQQEMRPSQVAGMICRDPQFWQFVNERSFAKVASEKDAGDWIRKEIGIKSRTELDSNILMLTRFNNGVLHPFNDYRRHVNTPQVRP